MRRRNFLALGSAGVALAGTRRRPSLEVDASCGCEFQLQAGVRGRGGPVVDAFANLQSGLKITGLKVFLNGKEVFAREEYHHGMELDQYVARGELKAGRNELLLKVCQNEQTEAWAQSWRFQVRLCAPAGVAVPFRVVAAGPVKEVRP